ncbi:MAG: glycoside hydrolase family 32 protein [Chloroflexi bacterium]|nr:glycoside hydrolase family 32 protein [Chloroflexota bacterium]
MKMNIIAEGLSDPYAPRYHLIAPEGAARPFDPNGALFWKGRYHLFYIFQDPALPHGGHCWGHVSSADLLHWDYHPTALAPAPGDPEMGIFSGCALLTKDGVPTLVYHGVGAGTCLAFAEDDDLIRWRKSKHNPVIPIPQEGDPGWGVYNVFDPHAWLEGDTYYVILGGKVKPHNLYDTAYLFSSPDLLRWRYLRPFYNPNPHWTGEEEDCACPDFFALGNRHALLCISHPWGARIYLGRWETREGVGTFVPEEHLRMNWPGGPCFAPESLIDDRGRRLFWAWALDQRAGEGLVTNALGVMTLPRALSLDEAGRLQIDPPVEFEALRREPRHIEGFMLGDGEEQRLAGIAGDTMELSLVAEVTKGGRLGLKVRASPDDTEETIILVDTAAGTLAIDTRRSTLASNVFQRHPIARGDVPQQDVRVQTAPLHLDPDEPLRLRIFLDRSMLEVFANRRQCVTQRIYPTREDSLGVALFAQGSAATVRSVEAWQMAPTPLGCL